MGLDLKLLPFDSTVMHDGSFAFSHTVLSCFRRGDLFTKIRKLPSQPAPKDFYTYVSTLENGEHGYGLTHTDPYGDPVETVSIADLLSLAKDEGVTDNPTNRAIWAYLTALADGKPHEQTWPDPDTQVALYWS